MFYKNTIQYKSVNDTLNNKEKDHSSSHGDLTKICLLERSHDQAE